MGRNLGDGGSSRSAVREARRLPNPGLIDASSVAPPSQRAGTRALPDLGPIISCALSTAQADWYAIFHV